MKTSSRRPKASLTILVLIAGLGIGAPADAAIKTLTNVGAKETQLYLHRNFNSCQIDQTTFTCQTRFTTVRWDYTWPSETACPTEEWAQRVALEWDWDTSIIPENAVVTDVDIDFGIGPNAAQYGINHFQVKARSARIPADNEEPAPGEGPPSCQGLFDGMSFTTTYADEGGWDTPYSRKVVDLGAQAVADIQAKIGNGDDTDNFFSVGVRSTQEGNYAETGGGFCVYVDPPGIFDCTDAVELVPPHYLIVRYRVVGNGTPPDFAPAANPETFTLLGNEPNPFSLETAIRYAVPAGGGDVKLGVYDVRGSLVRTLVDGGQAPGTQAVVWDGRDGGGQPVAAGVYFYRLEVENAVQTRKMILTK